MNETWFREYILLAFRIGDISPWQKPGLLILANERFLLQRESPDELSPERVLHSLHRQ